MNRILKARTALSIAAVGGRRVSAPSASPPPVWLTPDTGPPSATLSAVHRTTSSPAAPSAAADKQLAELGGLTRLALADHLSRGLEQADNLALDAAVTVKDACALVLTYDLLNPRQHLVKQLTVAFQDRLPSRHQTALYTSGDLRPR